jgi:hypothetical protein
MRPMPMREMHALCYERGIEFEPGPRAQRTRRAAGDPRPAGVGGPLRCSGVARAAGGRAAATPPGSRLVLCRGCGVGAVGARSRTRGLIARGRGRPSQGGRPCGLRHSSQASRRKATAALVVARNQIRGSQQLIAACPRRPLGSYAVPSSHRTNPSEPPPPNAFAAAGRSVE